MAKKSARHLNQNDAPAHLVGQNRLRLIIAIFALGFLAIGGRLVQVSMFPRVDANPIRADAEAQLHRPDILDRNGVLLATDINVPSIIADPARIIDVDEAVEALTATVPDLDSRELRRKLTSNKRFAWIKRAVSPVEGDAVYNLGIPGISTKKERRRVYPQGRLSSHVVGYVDVDTKGIAGIEKYLEDKDKLPSASPEKPAEQSPEPAVLSIDIRIQATLVDEISKAITKFKAIAGGGIVMDIHTGEVLSLVSLPDFNPNQEKKNFSRDQQNRMTGGVYELGSVIKAATFAMALDYGTANLESRYDARVPLIIGKAKIDDFRPTRRVLTVPEVFTNSSNIATAKMALEVGARRHQEFLRRLGLYERLQTELPEAARPIVPRRWSTLTTAQVAFGQGFAIQPLQGAAAVAGLLNGGQLITPTLFRRDRDSAKGASIPVIKPSTSEALRELFRLNVLEGSASKADVVGYRVGGKTGTAQKVVDGRYVDDQRLAVFIGAFPMDNPQYLVMVMLDDPKPIPGTYGMATAGWNAVPTAAAIIEHIAPMLSVEPAFTEDDLKKLAKAEAEGQTN